MNESGARKTSLTGTLFRSELEARWALFYRQMGIGHSYKEKPVDFDTVSCEPDFYLNSHSVWTMVCTMFPTGEEKAKARLLAERSGDPVYLFYGQIPDPHPVDPLWYSGSAMAFFPDGRGDEAYWWCECSNCESAGIEFEGRATHLPCGCLKRIFPGWDLPHDFSGRILRAYRVAREAKLTTASGDGHDELHDPNYRPLVK